MSLQLLLPSTTMSSSLREVDPDVRYVSDFLLPDVPQAYPDVFYPMLLYNNVLHTYRIAITVYLSYTEHSAYSADLYDLL